MLRSGAGRRILITAVLIFLFSSSDLLFSPEIKPSSNNDDAESDGFEFACARPVLASGREAPSAPPTAEGGDIAPMRVVWDPYPSLHSVAVDAVNDRVVLSDSNRGSLLFYPRTSGNHSAKVVAPEQQVRGPFTGMMFIAGVALDPSHREVFAVNNDIGDRMEVFPYDADGNFKPKRVLFVPHGSWGISLDAPRDELAISVEHINTVVIYRREATLGEAPLRVIHGLNTGLADPHGIAFDSGNHQVLVANHGNWAPLTHEEATKSGGGRFQLPSIATFADSAKGDVKPERVIQGKSTQLNWPMGISLDAVHNEIAVASYGNNSILIFRRNENGDAAPVRIIRGDQTGILGPMGVAIDTKNDELWVTNYRDHSAVVFPRTVQGNVAPKRIIRNAPVGTPAVGFGNPGAVAYDGKRDEILVPN